MLQEEPEPLQEGWLRTVTGERAPVHGWSNMQLGIGTLEIPHKMLVADIKDECILGFDFLMKHNCLVDLKESMLLIHNQQIPLQCPKETNLNCCKVSLDDSIDLPPMSETVASARILDRPSNSGWGILELENGLSIKPKDGLLVGRTLVNLNAERVPIHLMNLTSQPKRIKKGTEVAICNAVESVLIKGNPDGALDKERNEVVESVVRISKPDVCSKSEASRVQDSSDPSRKSSLSPTKPVSSTFELPCHLGDLFKRSTTDLTNEESKQLHDLLLRFADVFSEGPHDLGRTELVKHRINTEGSTPIRQPPRRLPFAKREEAAKSSE